MNRIPSVAVIGAGLSGLACATGLQAAGSQVRVFDKSRGPSGRMSTRHGPDWQADHGAPCFTARDPRFQAEVARWQSAGVAAFWSPRLAVIGGQDGHETQANLPRFVGVPRMSAPGRFMADTLPLTVQFTVNAIEQTPAGWRLSSQEQGPWPDVFDALVLAVPAPQAAPLLRTVAPALADVASRTVMRACWTLMLRYEAPLELPFDAAVINQGPLRWVARDSSKPGRPSSPDTWLLHATAVWSETHVEADPEWVASAMITAFTDLGGRVPSSWTAHRWRYADTQPGLHRVHCWDGERQIGLCGDWLNGGQVEGAWLSGHGLAEAMVPCLSVAV